MSKATLSVVMPNYNHAPYIREALEAILAQSFRPLEVIVVDDGSTDNSIAVIEEFVRGDPIVRLLRNERNMGVVFSVNRGLREASGDYVSFLGADDMVLPGLFEKSMNLLARYPQAGVCTALSRLIDEQGKDIVRYHVVPEISKTECFLPPQEVLATITRRGEWFWGNTAIYQRDALLKADGFLPELRSYCDAFVLQVIALKHGACFIPETLAVFRVTHTSFSSEGRNSPEVQLELMRHAEELMRSRYRDVFPEEYVKEFRKRTLYAAGVGAYLELQVHQRKCIARLDHFLEGSTMIDRLFLVGLRFIVATQTLTVRLYLYLRFRHMTWQVFKRGLGLLFTKLNHFGFSRCH